VEEGGRESGGNRIRAECAYEGRKKRYFKDMWVERGSPCGEEKE
jgi:hypothetical protein